MPDSQKMIISKSLFFILLLTIISGCSKTDEATTRIPDWETPTLTGFALRDVSGAPMGITGTPNVNNHIKGNPNNIEYSIVAYPNPCRSTLALMIHTPSPNLPKQIWIVKGKLDAPLSNSGFDIGMNNAIAGGQPLFQATTVASNFTINVSSLPSGYYRLYVKIEDNLLYDNLIIK